MQMIPRIPFSMCSPPHPYLDLTSKAVRTSFVLNGLFPCPHLGSPQSLSSGQGVGTSLTTVQQIVGLVARNWGGLSGAHCQHSSPFSLPGALRQKAQLYWYHTDGWRVKRCREMAEEGPEPGGVPIYRRRQDSGWRDLRANFPQGNYNLLLTSRDKLAYQVGSVCVCRCTCTYDEAPWVRGSGPCREAGPWHSGSAHAKGWLILQLLVPQLHELG